MVIHNDDMGNDRSSNTQKLTFWDYRTMPTNELLAHPDYDPARAVRIDDELETALNIINRKDD